MDSRSCLDGVIARTDTDNSVSRRGALLGGALERNPQGGCVRMEGVGNVDASRSLVCVVACMDYSGSTGCRELGCRSVEVCYQTLSIIALIEWNLVWYHE